MPKGMGYSKGPKLPKKPGPRMGVGPDGKEYEMVGKREPTKAKTRRPMRRFKAE